jgi:hypothetical protein
MRDAHTFHRYYATASAIISNYTTLRSNTDAKHLCCIRMQTYCCSASLKTRRAGSSTVPPPTADDIVNGSGLDFVYPYGASMTVQAPALPLLSSGPISYPLNRPIAGVWEKGAEKTVGKDVGKDVESSSRGPGRLLVMASTEVFGDDWLEKEENGKLCDVLMRWLLDEGSIKLQRQVRHALQCLYTDAITAYDRVSVLLLLMTTVAVVL